MSDVPNRQSIDLKAQLFRGFSDRTRLSILEALRESLLTVTEIVDLTGLSQSNVSNHLACLRGCGLVSCEQRGRYVYYQLSNPRIDSVLLMVEDLLSDIGSHVYECTRYRNRPSARKTATTGDPPKAAGQDRGPVAKSHGELDCADLTSLTGC